MLKNREYYTNPRTDLIKFIPKESKHILEIGCGAGETGRFIKKELGESIEVVGVELSSEIAKEARKYMNNVIAGDIETINLPFQENYFDCIIYGDILEHLKDPWSLLKKHCALLKSTGCVIASIPNIAHYRIIKMLKNKEWCYQNAGILDIEHIRFFTIKTIKNMFRNAGLIVLEIKHLVGASTVRKVINSIFFNKFLDSLTEQYIVVAKRLR